MTAQERKRFEYALQQEVEQAEQPAPEAPEDDSAAATRHENQALWVELQIRKAIERGEFDNLPGAGKPIPGDDRPHDPQWWVKQLIERENITGVLPPALGLRREDAELDDLLDGQASEPRVREIVQEFNQRIIEARRQLQGGPPVITAPRDVDEQVELWRERRAERVRRAQQDQPAPPPRRHRWFRSR